MKGTILQLQPFSVNDGEGIRTTVFLAGCPLRCKWCSNPEGFDHKPKTAFYEKLCIGCGLCTTVCHLHGGINLNEPSQRAMCDGCGACADICPKQAKKRMVVETEADEIVESVKKHRLFYARSGGGITFSGGEATMQADFLDELSEKLYDMGFHLAIETSGYFDFERVKPILARMDQIFMDLKHMDDEIHREYTGVSNQKILENMKRLGEFDAEVVIRIPVIRPVNATEENIRKSGEFVHTYLPKAKMELLPYHKFGFGKYEALGMTLPSEEFSAPSEEEMENFRNILEKTGVETISYR
ncbi:glycyl-radical enzyme activating protein [Anaerotignum lactatifermentans]|uniref:Glycyl-radical enzyme activating protein n=1 Tax=Anaerotignum lactatifermentans TaxID=160404 RepID=A0ABS2G6L4_9FIRM|nr:glycyl-radical enzyme activating protein [Anaerotignum lactatifermentans]MBM6828022.1 glycyl-radical enzyme activating protein [Anaerotignum lactatifermentans]MBM6876815.1 glycyl-radical enzyme activating protein [Anaerotignum lactatifermentans]MBM6949605.1 glycyl-radical enzyme activating protein [Anaerotignum lactatifermentans]